MKCGRARPMVSFLYYMLHKFNGPFQMRHKKIGNQLTQNTHWNVIGFTFIQFGHRPPLKSTAMHFVRKTHVDSI